MLSMYDLPTGRISERVFSRYSRRAQTYLKTWDDRFRWQRTILALLPDDEQQELEEWAQQNGPTNKDRTMLILIVFFRAALNGEDLRHSKAGPRLQVFLNKLQDKRTARGTMLPKKAQEIVT